MLKLLLPCSKTPIKIRVMGIIFIVYFLLFLISIIPFGVNIYNFSLIVFAIIIIYLYSIFNKRNIEVIGEILLFDSKVEIKYYDGNHNKYPFEEVDKISIDYEGYDGRNDSGFVFPFEINNGDSNRISIYMINGDKIIKSFYLTNPRFVYDFKKLARNINNIRLELIDNRNRKRLFRNY